MSSFELKFKNLETQVLHIHHHLTEKCKKGDRNSQNELYRLYFKQMFNTALRIVNDFAEAEEIMQDAFLSAFNNIKSFKGEVTFGAWLKKIVVNKSLDYLKKQKVRFVEINNSDEIHESENDDFDYTELMVNEIKQKIRLLPDGYRVILSLYLLEGFDHEEISEILKITPSTSRSQFTRAKNKLLNLLHSKN